MKTYTFEELLDEDLGAIGTPRRDKFEADVEAEVKAYYIGEAIRTARKKKNLTQEQLGQLMGVQRAQISKIENGKNLNFTTISKAFRAMGVAASLNFGGMQVSLW